MADAAGAESVQRFLLNEKSVAPVGEKPTHPLLKTLRPSMRVVRSAVNGEGVVRFHGSEPNDFDLLGGVNYEKKS